MDPKSELIKSGPKPKPSGLKAARATRRAHLCKLLAHPSGLSIEQMQQAFGWRPHTARTAQSALRKAETATERAAGTDKGAVYRISGEV